MRQFTHGALRCSLNVEMRLDEKQKQMSGRVIKVARDDLDGQGCTSGGSERCLGQYAYSSDASCERQHQ